MKDVVADSDTPSSQMEIGCPLHKVLSKGYFSIVRRVTTSRYLIPCHRIIGSDGAMGNYHYGKTRKQAMIGWENARLGS